MEAVMRPYLVQLGELTNELETKENKREKVLVFMNEAPFSCYMKSAETGRYEFINKSALETLGLSEEAVLGKTDLEIYSLETAKVLIGHDLKLLNSRQAFIAMEARTHKGRTALYLVAKFLVKNGAESIGGIAVEVPDTFRLESATQG